MPPRRGYRVFGLNRRGLGRQKTLCAHRPLPWRRSRRRGRPCRWSRTAPAQCVWPLAATVLKAGATPSPIRCAKRWFWRQAMQAPRQAESDRARSVARPRRNPAEARPTGNDPPTARAHAAWPRRARRRLDQSAEPAEHRPINKSPRRDSASERAVRRQAHRRAK